MTASVSLKSGLRLMALAFILSLVAGGSSLQAQEWSNYMHWPYQPPQYGSAYHQQSLYDGNNVYPREMRMYPQIPGAGYYNFYRGQKIWGDHRTPAMWETGHNYRVLGGYLPGPINAFHSWGGQRFYYGNHFKLDVF